MQARPQTRDVFTLAAFPDSGKDSPESPLLAVYQGFALDLDGLGRGSEARQSATHNTRREKRPERER
jgi:hypothetical protein